MIMIVFELRDSLLHMRTMPVALRKTISFLKGKLVTNIIEREKIHSDSWIRLTDNSEVHLS